MVALSSCIFSGGSSPKVGNSIAGQVHQRSCDDFSISFKNVDLQTFIWHQSCERSLAQLKMLWFGMKSTRMHGCELRKRF